MFGLRARICRTPVTEKLGLAGLEGRIHGETRPSSSGVTGIVGNTSGDYAINVYFAELKKGFWFAEELVELPDADGERRPGLIIGKSPNELGWEP